MVPCYIYEYFILYFYRSFPLQGTKETTTGQRSIYPKAATSERKYQRRKKNNDAKIESTDQRRTIEPMDQRRTSEPTYQRPAKPTSTLQAFRSATLIGMLLNASIITQMNVNQPAPHHLFSFKVNNFSLTKAPILNKYVKFSAYISSTAVLTILILINFVCISFQKNKISS